MVELTGELMGDILKLVTEGSVLGLPTLGFMAVPFVIGLIIGIMIKKAFKIALILLVAIGAGVYLGFMNISDLKVAGANLVETHGSAAQQYASMLIGMLPLGTGLVVGLIIGLKFG
ncbi:MAG: hypothetical protein ACE5Z5_07350 [Candidatus Bathyarchaeia archaeon]